MKHINIRYAMKLVTVFTIITSIFIMHSSADAEEKAPAARARSIIIKNSSEGVSPVSITVKRGDTVVWYNQGNASVSIRFLSQLNIVCSPLVNFYADISGSYKTGMISQGGTASLCFVYAGVYDYEVQWGSLGNKQQQSAKHVTGKVIVEK